ncbi:hypothetical protein [Chlorobium sp. N1]|uniref:hypothetical protein n=1 Tax=Chlorobium sp. N1 TaxID=2491138 RepID=UPI00103CD9AA|nr:hypothetical protein [Chlorobium sp. N1]TCD47438.1 hypothetical protein E0L29_07795 [Chlorobium sp. N1]
MEKRNVTAGVYSTHEAAGQAVGELRTAGYDLEKVSLIGRDCCLGEHVSGFYKAGERLLFRGKLEPFWSRLAGELAPSASFFVPGIGQVMLFGPLVEWLNSALERNLVVGGLSAVGAALFSIGLPKECIVKYEKAIKAGRFLVVASGGADEAELAREILNRKSDNDAVVYHSSAPD